MNTATTNTMNIVNSVHIRTNWTFTQAEVTVHQLLSNLGESTKDCAKHDIKTAGDVTLTALEIWDKTAA